MNLKKYCIDKRIHFLLALSGILMIEGVLFLFTTPITLQMMILGIYSFIIGLMMSYDYLRQKRFYQDLENKLNKLEEKYFVVEMLEKPSFLQGQLLYRYLNEILKSMNDEIFKNVRKTNDFKQYIELWVHEIKLPIASLKLIIHNYRHQASRKLNDQIKQIENQVEGVLYYTRSEVPENDYMIQSYDLKKVVESVIKNNRDTLLINQIKIQCEISEEYILTDEKWASFMIGQILSNAIKYSKDSHPCIRFYAQSDCKQVSLYIEDNGIGIEASDIERVFDKSFTGKNGRIKGSSTGMGLYLCKKLCKELNHDIKIESKVNEYTRVILTFSKDNLTAL